MLGHAISLATQIAFQPSYIDKPPLLSSGVTNLSLLDMYMTCLPPSVFVYCMHTLSIATLLYLQFYQLSHPPCRLRQFGSTHCASIMSQPSLLWVRGKGSVYHPWVPSAACLQT